MRQETILRKAGELSTLCDNEICVIHYDRVGNLVRTWPEDESQVQVMAERYSQLTDEEKQKKSTNLSKFVNKKMHDEKKRSPIEFSQKVQELEGSLVSKLQLLRDMMLREDHRVMSEQNTTFLHSSSGFVSKDSSSSSLPDHQQQIESSTNLLRNGSTSTEQDLSRGDVYNSTATGSFNHQSKYSIFMFNHENATLSQLPHSISSSLEQSLIPSYYNNLNDHRALLGAQGFNDNNNLSTTQGFFNFGYDNNALPGEQVNFGYYNSLLGTQGFGGYDNNLNYTQGFNNLCT
ncbi:unnamed protein product [Brassica oleracea]|uniref:(rape) hypothetical protein n=1 Tax=Brassica napus TaxID=3708 RepID=A0A816UQT7_BRANA|nr:unnamed protein product [Brassica napus]